MKNSRATRRRPATPTEAAQALAAVRQLFRMTPRERAEQRMRTAKDRYTEATEASIRGDADAGEQVDVALAELNAARAALEATP